MSIVEGHKHTRKSFVSVDYTYEYESINITFSGLLKIVVELLSLIGVLSDWSLLTLTSHSLSKAEKSRDTEMVTYPDINHAQRYLTSIFH